MLQGGATWATRTWEVRTSYGYASSIRWSSLRTWWALYLEFWQLGPVGLGVWGVPVCGSYSELGTETCRIVGRCQVLRMGIISVSISSGWMRIVCWHFWVYGGVSAKLQVFISQDRWISGGSALAHSYNSVSYRNCEICGAKSEDLEKLKISCFSCVTIFVLEVNGKGFKVICKFVLVCFVNGRRDL